MANMSFSRGVRVAYEIMLAWFGVNRCVGC